MACLYFYNGHQFNSELELDDFLLEKEQYYNEFKDTVFSATNAQLGVLKRLGEINKETKELYDKYKEFRRKAKYNEDGEPDIDKPPYIGVNKFLGQVIIDDKQLLMEFRPDEYWSRRYEKWEEGDFTKDELDTFKITQGTRIQKQVLGKNKKGETITNYSKMREQMEKRWKEQALIGTAVHNVLQLYFTYQDNMYGYERENIKDYIEKNLEPKNKEKLNSKVIDDTIAYAQKLRESLEKELGEGLLFMPEFMAASDIVNPNTGNTETILGIIDLVIIDKHGRTHILDYKTSVKEYKDFGIAKQRAYAYQMATYQRILDRYGINVSEGSLIVAPIQITKFGLDDEDKYTYESITYNKIIDVINSHLTPTNWAKVEVFLPPIINISITTEKLLENTGKFMSRCFPAYGNVGMITEKGVIKHLEKLGLLKKPESGIYEYKPYGSSEEPITATTPQEFIEKVLKYRKSLIPRKIKTTTEIKRLLKKAIKEQTPNVNWPQSSAHSSGVSATWLRDTLRRYCNQRWEVVDNETLESYGIIQILNKDTGQIDYIKISANELTTNYNNYLDKNDPNRNRKGLTGNFQIDLDEQAKTDSLMLEGAIGNIELMEMMAIISQLNGLSSRIVGNIQVINPYDGRSVQASNEELKYCFSALTRFAPIIENNFDNGNIKLASRYQLLSKQFADILANGELNQWKDNYKYFENFKSCTSILDQSIVNPEDQIDALENMKRQLENDITIKPIISRTYKDSEHLNSDLVSLYSQIELALAELKGIKLRQQLQDHGQWFDDVYHLSATYLDNPGNLSSETLNVITKKLTEAYQNTRDEIQRKKNEMQKVFDKYKEYKGWNYLKENVGFNQVDLYKDLYYESPEGDLLFKDLRQLNEVEREFLEYVLEEINKERHPDWTSEIRKIKRDSYDIEYYRVPLARGESDSIVSSRGLLSLLKEKIQNWDPRVILRKAREKAEGIYEAQTGKNEKILNLYKMTNMFDRGNESTEARLNIIKKNGIHTFERNIEYLLLKHNFAYSQQRNLDKVFPLIKAATIHLTYQGSYQNRSWDQDIKYIEEYITNKIHKKSIVNPNIQEAMTVINVIKQAASKLTLAFAPVQMLYQPLQGLWQDISLMIRKPDGKDSFTFKHFKNAIKLVYSDLLNFTGKPTLCSLLNEQYALNDMDINMYIDRITKTKKGIWNWDNMLFKFASRPDFYNRMSIFVSQMQGDGCLEAHSVKDGKLIYDWTKDKRFSKYAENPNLKTNDLEYNKQKSLYYTIAKQFENEGATVEINGKIVPFKVNMENPMPLPRAYTNKQAESMKSLSDDIYGYYSEEKKSLVMATAVGGLWLQFKTYWSGKKNQYLQAGGVRLRGSWEHYQQAIINENGEIELNPDGTKKMVKYYYKTDANSNILFKEGYFTEEQMKAEGLPLIAPVMQWKGQWQEGILVTLGDIGLKILKDPKHFVDHFRNKWNDSDEDLRRCYRSNMKQFIYDLIMFAVVGSILGAVLGDWLDDLKEENEDNDDFMTGVMLAAANVAVMSVKNSFLDFNFIESVGSPVGQWTPFSIEWAGRQISNIMKVASGDEDIWDGALNVAGASKQLRPIFDAIKPEMFRTKREGGTWESATARRNREEQES